MSKTPRNRKRIRHDSPPGRARLGKPVIAVSAGDPAGVGPEIVAHLFAKYKPARSVALLVGARQVFRPWFERFGCPLEELPVPSGGRGVGTLSLAAAAAIETRLRTRGIPRVFTLDTGCRERYSLGRDSKSGGRHAGIALELVCHLAASGHIAGLVTAPISKRSLGLAGYPFTGHTEMFSHFFDAPDCQMVMVHGKFRVVPLTRHLPLKDVSRALTVERVTVGLLAVAAAIKEDFGVVKPHLAVAGLNPHAGDGGIVGKEEIDVIVPAIKRVRRRGVRITGPVPGDALFQQAETGEFDVFVSMYHDQGLIPFKLIAKRRGVNVTVGLPLVRTSVDHGVAYDIAGKGVANVASLEAAYRLAEQLVNRRRVRAKGRRN
ncbi:MAG: 4-hydroxythreonine-4-phosphate dehydrogenase PdxA [Candidatus Latescibacterota bacterium]|nr:MAG: 4-hydroxythreonine-4-phosphate dehydrogenase PdxA [Candidatus Latescibacterota bacterium]